MFYFHKKSTKKKWAKTLIKIGEKLFYVPAILAIGYIFNKSFNYTLVIVIILTIIFGLMSIHKGLKILDKINNKKHIKNS